MMRLRPAAIAGFTLLELMLVILLVGLLATMVTLNFSGESRHEKLSKEAERFQQITQYVAETALLKQQEWGLYVLTDRYGFLYYDYDSAKWLAAEEPDGLREHKLPQDISMTLELDGLEAAEDNLLSQLDWQLDEEQQDAEEQQDIPVLPQVFILSSGEISPFKLLFAEQSELQPLYSAVSTDFSIPLKRSDVSAEQP
ncbi:type II secretion system minor pseudopilin GspH [Rheinheimera muenzenbergensis]|uniref:Type II secretion system protein H n=1 Tax=Rheinheimera muenzenbergensis TaxID=1193628 RepID=A0ABU8C5U4_9GAMM